MCGIFGYVGKHKNAALLTLDGLKLLEYRGYDSWGIAVKNQESIPIESGSKVKNQNAIIIEKHVGKIGEASINLPESNIGIGHTRWATHGGVTKKNAHPHLDCNHEIAVIHNGIIENYTEIREELISKGHKFLSETDTEVIPHLIEDQMHSIGFAYSVRSAFNRLSGLNAIVVLCAPSQEIIAAKTGSPLIIGEKNDELFVASDASGIIKHTNKLIFLKDHEMVILGKKIQLIDLASGKKLPTRFETVDWKVEDADKGSYENFMLKEIHEQSKIVKNIAQNYEDQIVKLAKIVKKARGTFFIGAGTAFYAGLAGKYFFSKIANTHVNTTVASEFNYLEDFLTDKSLVIALTQSGETIDVVEPLNRAKLKGSIICSILNTLGSTVYRMSDEKLMLGAGPEKAVASTKAYTAKLSVLLMLSYALKGEIDTAKKALISASDEIERLLSSSNQKIINVVVDILEKAEHIYVIGRGVSYSTSLEAALKIKEVSYIHTEGLAGGELKHGTIALITKGTPCIVFAPKDETFDAIISNATEVKARGGVIIGIGPIKSKIFDHWIEVRDIYTASVIAQIIPIQLIAYHLALRKGYDPDKPRNLAKSVTVK